MCTGSKLLVSEDANRFVTSIINDLQMW